MGWINTGMLVLAMMLTVHVHVGIDDEVIRHPNPQEALSQRWTWAQEQAEDRRAPYWVGYSIERMMESGSFIGSWGRHRETRPSLRSLISGMPDDEDAPSERDAARRALDRSEGRNAPRQWERKDVAILFLLSPEGQVQEVEISNMELHVDLEDRPLYWLGPAEEAESLELVQVRLQATQGSGVREELVTTIGIHQSTDLVVPILTEVLHGEDEPDVREQAAFWLGQTDEPEALRVLTTTARADRSGDVREQAVFSISEMELEAALDVLIDLARQAEDSGVRSKAIFWLGQHASERVTDLLKAFVADEQDTEVQKHAVFALSQQPVNRGVPVLIEIARTHPNPEVRKQAIFWLGESGDDRALDVLIELAQSE